MSIQQSDISPAGGVTRAVLRATTRYRRVRRIILSLAVGVVAGLLAAGYSHTLDWLTGQLQGGLAGVRGTGHPGESTLLRPWALPLMTTLVGALTGWLVSRFAPEAATAGTYGTDAMIKALHQGRGRIRPLALLEWNPPGNASCPLFQFVSDQAMLLPLAQNIVIRRFGPVSG